MRISNIQKAISGEKLDGWLFFNFHHRDPLSDQLLGIDRSRINSRPWYYLVPDEGEPIKICHAVEPEQLDELPGKLNIYNSREQLTGLLSEAVKKSGNNWGAQYSVELTTISTLDHGTALMLEGLGIKLHSSAGLIQRLNGLLDAAAIKTHEEAADNLYEIVDIVWNRISEHFKKISDAEKSSAAGNGNGKKFRPLLEHEVQQWILDEFKSRNMVSEHLPIVACGPNSGNPHYAPEEHDNPITQNNVLQLDLWAKFDKEGSIFADISWIGWTGSDVPEDIMKMFKTVIDARDRCAAFIDGELSAGRTVSGSDADKETRKVLIDRGYADLIKHRTGHGIDTDVHGSGTGLDSVEFPDKRPILEGSCFSIEPGLYFEKYGMRTEIDAFIRNGRLEISGPGPQKEILTIENL